MFYLLKINPVITCNPFHTELTSTTNKRNNLSFHPLVVVDRWPCLFFVDGIEYQSAEHYMMAEKALLFKDYEIREKILKSTDSKYAKDLGRKVKGFREDVWKENCYEIVKRGNYEKFGQNEDLKNYLLSTNSKILVEASPVDLIWGIGLDENAKDIKNPLVWRGTNLLGFILMEVRDDLELYMG
ncbi:MAG: NADAR family protein [Paenibacillaceae bacterium]|nr:NADAR family protein [Paenibacillaceae bacterium]